MNGENINIRGHLSLIDRSKTKFIICGKLNNIPTIISFFSVIGKEPQPSLIVNHNRYFYVKKLLDALPSIFVLKSDGDNISIDAVHKCIEFTQDTIKGIVQYEISEPNTLIPNIKNIYTINNNKYIPNYLSVKLEDEIEKKPNKLKVIPCILNNGFMITILDFIEKILYISLLEDNLIGITTIQEMNKAIMIQNFWPELNLAITIKDENVFIYCDILKQYSFPSNSILKIHRNFGGTDISIENIAINR